MKNIISATEKYVREELYGESSGHDWWHVYRVWKLAIRIGRAENADMLVIELSALLHDIADWKHNNGDFTVGPKVARRWLSQFEELDSNVVDQVAYNIEHTSFKGVSADQPELTLEGLILQDADRLDAIGAIGVARTFAYGGKKDKIMYDPNIPPVTHQSVDSYIHNNSPTINHFYEKLLLLKDRMNTEMGKKIAIERHTFMVEFLNHFYAEWEGTC